MTAPEKDIWADCGALGAGTYVRAADRPIAVFYGPEQNPRSQADVQLACMAPALLRAAKSALIFIERELDIERRPARTVRHQFLHELRAELYCAIEFAEGRRDEI